MSAAFSTTARMAVHDAATVAGDCSANADSADYLVQNGGSPAQVIERLTWALEQARSAAIRIDQALSAVKVSVLG